MTDTVENTYRTVEEAAEVLRATPIDHLVMPSQRSFRDEKGRCCPMIRLAETWRISGMDLDEKAGLVMEAMGLRRRDYDLATSAYDICRTRKEGVEWVIRTLNGLAETSHD